MSDLQREPTGQSAPPGQAPAVPAGEMQAASGPSGPRAGFGTRLLAYLIDVVVLAIRGAVPVGGGGPVGGAVA